MAITAGLYFKNLDSRTPEFGGQDPKTLVLTVDQQRKIDKILNRNLEKAPPQPVSVDKNQRYSCDLFDVFATINVAAGLTYLVWGAYNYFPWEIFKH
ncbi:MAG: hypothetical protein JSS32_04315 [Verrucomicrobia bacterium]|nr:hypothetical protein [Verrucomicrobiota bacterium]